MKIAYFSTIIMALLVSTACGNSEKKEAKSTSEETETVKPSKQKGIDLKQKGDYNRLYSESKDCKLTAAQLAEALGYDADQVEEQSNYQGNCWFKVTHPGNFTVNYGISLENWRKKNVVEDAIRSGLKNDLVDVQVSKSGDTYIKRHPVQGFLLLLNTHYGNPINISYSYLNPNGAKLTDVQKEERKQNTYKIANYLIDHYQN